MKDIFKTLYELLYAHYGPQGWWPEVVDGKGVYDIAFSQAKRPAHAFEICIGAILTQNTSWLSVCRALYNLKREGKLEPEALCGEIKDLIKPAGYFNQKAKKLAVFSTAWQERNWSSVAPQRQELLALWGIGEETADDMLLYAFGVPVFIVDTYTKRLLSKLDMQLTAEQMRAQAIKDTGADLYTLRELHALIDLHAGTRCRAKGGCKGCPLMNVCFNKDIE